MTGRPKTPSFRDRTVVITGASAGIGAAAAKGFATRGANVVLAARGPQALETLAAQIQDQGGRALAVPTDVADITAVDNLLRRAAEHFGGVDIVVNNAGANRRGPIENFEPEQLAQVVAVNLTAPIVTTRLAIPYLRKSDVAAVVNVASLAGRIPVVHEAVYSATKFGLRAFTMAVAEELEEAGIRVSVVSPGPVDTGFIMEVLDDVPDLVFSQPMSTAEEIAELIFACAADGRIERMRPRLGGHLATLGYVFPTLRRMLLPMMEARGRRAKRRYLARRDS